MAWRGYSSCRGSQVIKFEPSLTLALNESGATPVPAGDRERDTSPATAANPRVWSTIRSASISRCGNTGEGVRTRPSSSRCAGSVQIGEEILEQAVIPRIVRPLAQAIASR